jgi:hypothetical protein
MVKKRKRIMDKRAGALVVVDPLMYIENLSSSLARHIETVTKRSEFKIWIDKHYNVIELYVDGSELRRFVKGNIQFISKI